jgi:hypothetical protein
MIQVKQNDRRPVATATIKRGGSVVPLSGASYVQFKMTERTSQQLKVNATAVIVSAAAGTVEYRWAIGDTDTPGTYDAEWEVNWADGTSETFPTNHFDIVVIYGDLDGRAGA